MKSHCSNVTSNADKLKYLKFVPSLCTYMIIYKFLYSFVIITEVTSINSTLHCQFAAVHCWLTLVLDSSTTNEGSAATLISANSVTDLEYWLTDTQKNRSTCVDIFNPRYVYR